ncbi:MAG TPA: cellulose binding domain-containing protein [Mycobacteriales bacterium]|nr:cellulose binding domain-containing protein [Mycobacteriales bacterium]
MPLPPTAPAGPRRARPRSGAAGFTLVELLVVVVVLGILATIVVIGVGRFRTDANAAACQADVHAVNAAADEYHAVTGEYPAELAQLTLGQYLMSTPSSGTFTFDAASRTATRSPACAGGPGSTAGTVPTPAGTGSTGPAATTPATTGAPATTTAAAGLRCTAGVVIENSWPQGYQAAITVSNTGTSTFSPWTATWTLPAGVTLNNGWFATVTQSGSVVTAEAPSWSTTLAPGTSWTIGFIANGPFSPPPSDVRVNGTGCG